MKKNHLAKYIRHYAERVSIEVSAILPDDVEFTHCILIPAYNEKTDFLSGLKNSHLLRHKSSNEKTLVILVINQPENTVPSIQNQRLWDWAFSSGECIVENNRACLLKWSESENYLLAIDCFNKGKHIATKEGVGLARKIACDIACALIDKGQLRTRWLYNTDADAILPNNYFSSRLLNLNQACSAIVFNYRHIAQSESEKIGSYRTDDTYTATKIIEHSLRYYTDGLRYAKSPYAYQSLGSCICVNAQYYAQARGFPKRSGGEDFYLLNKLNKLSPVMTDNEICIELQSRASTRVPFGTGPAVAAALKGNFSMANYPYYNPEVFIALNFLLHQLNILASHETVSKTWLQKLPNETQEALTAIGFSKFMSHFNQHKNHNHEQAVTAINNWFDAFKTLKFIHSLEKTNPDRFAKIGLETAIKRLEGLNQKK